MAGDTDNTKTVCFDLDGTLCTNTYGEYDTAEPFPWAIERLNALARAGHRIVVFTARGTATGIDWTEVTRGQLDRWGVLYDDLKLGKPSADVYVDDRAVHTTAWREGDAFAVPGFGLPLPGDRPEELPGVLASQRTTVVESGRTWGGRPVLAHQHLERLRARAHAAGISEVPGAGELAQALDTALERADSGAEMVFTVAVADGVAPAFLDVAEERAHGPVVTVRTLDQVLAALDTPPAELGGLPAAVVDGRLALGDPGAEPGPLAAVLPELAREAGVQLHDQPLGDHHREQADEAFHVVEALGMLTVAGQDAVRPRLEAALTARAGAR